jgi:amino acid adenylation domain-containing protein
LDKRARLAELLRQKAGRSDQSFPLSYGQQALWFLSQLAPANSAYNLPIALPFSETVDPDALTHALESILNRHACLRTIFVHEDGQLLQRIKPVSSLCLHRHDAAGLREEELRQRLRKENRQPFDLVKGPLLRACLFTRSENDHILLLTVHHIVFDGISSLILMDELLTLYDAVKTGKTSELTSPSGEYAEYVRWQQNLLEGPEGDKLCRYWQEQLVGELPVVDLPTDRPRQALQSYNGDTWKFQVDEILTRRLKHLAQAEDATLFMLLLAAFHVLLHRYSGQRDIITGSPMMGRTKPGFERIIGYFINTVAIRSDLSGNPSFRSFLRQIVDNVYGALEHQDYPFPLLVQRLKVSRDPSRSPVFQVAFNLETWIRDGGATNRATNILSRLRLEPFGLLQQEGELDLTLDVFDMGQNLHCALRYNPDLFDRITICKMAEHFRVLLWQLCDGPERCLSEFPILTDFERQRLLRGWNNTHTPYPKDKCFPELFEAQAIQNPDRVAVIYEDQSLSYRELNARSNQVAHYLRSLGVRPGSLVAVCLERSIEMLLATLGVMKAGCAYVPLDPTYPQERLSFMMADANVSMLLTQQRLANILHAQQARQVYLDTGWEAISAASSAHLPLDSGPDNLAYVIYTSGSTGKPKGVEIRHQSLVNFLHAMALEPGLGETDVLLAVTTLSFDIAALELYLPLLKGARIVIATHAETSDGWKLLAKVKASGTTMMQATPATWKLMLTCGWNEPLNLTMLCGGETLDRELADQLLVRGRELWNMFGPTETTIWSTTGKVQPGQEPISVGRPIANTQVYILDERLQLVPIGASGELYIGGDGLARGYLGQGQLTGEKFIPHPFSQEKGARIYRTGDLARYLRDGRLQLLGRIDHQIKIRGFRIELGEIEAVLSKHPAVRQAVVIARDDFGGEKRLVAYLIEVNQGNLSLSDLRRHLKQNLPDYMIPSDFMILDAFPLTPNGKLDRKSLPASEATTLNLTSPRVAPRNQIEKTVLDIWARALNRKEVGIHDNFFELGGHSLLAAQVVSKMREHFEIELLDLFTYPTISTLTEYLCKNQGSLASGLDRSSAESGQVAEVGESLMPVSQPSTRSNDIAVIGMAGRFPGAANIEAFWENLKNGVESISFFSDEELLASGVSPELLSRPDYVKASGKIAGADLFDARFFGYSNAHAKLIDPQQRLLLECAWETLEDAGCNPDLAAGSVGVYLAVAGSTYYLPDLHALSESVSPTAAWVAYTSNDKDFAATRISYKLNLKGPSITVQTACSSSLVAVHLACQSLISGECDFALAGGASLIFPQTAGYVYQRDMVFSRDGHCRAFDARAEGTVSGSGVALVALRRLDQAIAQGDQVVAVIKGSAINNDGLLKVDYMAPSVQGQAEAIARAMSRAGVSPETIGYVETHGTGTVLGDPIEIKALTRAFNGSPRKRNCAIGSVKTNVGHLNTAAGVTSLIKAALSLKHKVLVPSLHFEQPNPHIDFENSPFFVNTRLAEWKKGDTPRRAGVSSFGIGGTNAHAVLEEAPEIPAQESSRGWHFLPLSAKTESGLQATTANLAEHLKQHPNLNVADVAYTLQLGRKTLEHRQFLVCKSRQDALTALGREDAGRIVRLGETPNLSDPELAFLFVGEGAQYVRMAWELYQTEPVFRDSINHLAEILWPAVGVDLRQVLYPKEAEYELASRQAQQISFAQPLLFVVEYGLAKLWQEWGISPEAVIGQGVGEFTAGCLAGVFSPEAGLMVVAEQARLIQQLPSGCMFEVSLPERELHLLVSEHIGLAVVPSPNQCCVAGPAEAMDHLCRQLAARGIGYRRLSISHALHTDQMGAVVDHVRHRLTTIELRPPRVPMFSGSTAACLSPGEAMDPNYWARVMMKQVRLSDGLVEILRQPNRLLLEVGPRRTRGAFTGTTHQQEPFPLLHSLGSPDEGFPDSASMLSSLGYLWLCGKRVDWAGFHAHEKRRKVSLPSYPFERSPYWLEDRQQLFSSASKPITGDPHSVRPELHPLVDSKESTRGAEVFKTTFTGSEFFLRDHVLAGQKILPGVTYLEMARAAGELASKGAQVKHLINLACLRPVTVKRDPVDVFISLSSSKEGAEYEVTTQKDASKILHARGKLVYEPHPTSVVPPQFISLDEIKSRCSLIANREQIYSLLRTHDVHYGTSMQSIHELFSNEHEALAALVLPPTVPEGLDAYLLHPSLLDSALQAVMGLTQKEAIADRMAHLPYLLGGLEILRPLSRECYAYVTSARRNNASWGTKAAKTFDISVVDPHGNVLVLLRDYTVKFVRLESLSSLASTDGGAARPLPLNGPIRAEEDLAALTNATVAHEKSPSLAPGTGHLHQAQSLEMGETTATAFLSPDGSVLQELVCQDLKQRVEGILGMDKNTLNSNVDMGQYGLDSVGIIDFVSGINEDYELNLSPAIFFEHKTIYNFATYLVEQHPEVFRQHFKEGLPAITLAEVDGPEGETSGGRHRFDERPAACSNAPTLSGSALDREPIAVVGMSGIFPRSPNVAAFWQNLMAGKDLICEIPKERWDWETYFGDPQKEPNKTNIKWGGFIEDADKFDALFFSISPRQAELMDPQHRLFLEVVWKTIEDAGHRPSSLAGSRTGLFVGMGNSDYSELMQKTLRSVEIHSGAGIAHGMLPNRISYLLNLHGPSEPVDTACSSSLVAVHRAIEAIYNGDCEQAIAGGVNLMLTPSLFIYFNKSGMLSPDGRCWTFDKRANGYARGEGAGAVLLKPLNKALTEGDHIYGLIRGTAVNHGGRTKSMGAPNPHSEAEVVMKAFERAQIDPETVTYIEAHGTGTALGDPVEINGLKEAFAGLNEKLGKHTSRKHYCGLGSVKTNVGHLEAAAGMAGLIKVLLSLRHKQLPGTSNFKELNPYIEINDSPFFILDRPGKWEALVDESGRTWPLRAGISSFGIGGVNAHIVIEEYRAEKTQSLDPAEEQKEPQLILLSARDQERLRESAQNLVDWLAQDRNARESSDDQEIPSLADIAFTLQVGREALAERLAFVVASREELQEKLQAWLTGTEVAGIFSGRGQTTNNPSLKNDFVRSMIDQGKLEEISALWASGKAIDWELLPRNRYRQRVSLPTTPFARQRHWLPEPAVEALPVGPPAKPQAGLARLHPLIDSNESTWEETTFRKVFTGEEFVLREHVIGGKRTLPGVACLEMARAAGDLATSLARIKRIRNVVWSCPLVMERAPIDARVRLFLTSEAVTFEVSSMKDQQTCLHVRGELIYGEEAPLDPGTGKGSITLDIAEIINRSTIQAQKHDLYRQFNLHGFSYGPALQSIHKLYSNDTEALAELRLPETLLKGFNDYLLHPSLLDGAVQSFVGIFNGLGTAIDPFFLPYTLDEAEIVEPLTPHCYAYATLTQGWRPQLKNRTMKFDLLIVDGRGNDLVRVKELCVGAPELGPQSDPVDVSERERLERILDQVTADELTVDEGVELIGRRREVL